VLCIFSGAKILVESAVQISGPYKINHFHYYLHHFIEHSRKLFGSHFPVNDAVFDVNVWKFSLKGTSKSNISSHHRWSAVDATLYDTTSIKLILREKSIHSAKNIVPCCCRMQRQRTKKLLYYATSTCKFAIYTNTLSLSLLVVRRFDDDAAQRVSLCRHMWLLRRKHGHILYRRIPAALSLEVVGCAVGVCAHALLLPHQYVAVQMLPAPCRKLHAILLDPRPIPQVCRKRSRIYFRTT